MKFQIKNIESNLPAGSYLVKFSKIVKDKNGELKLVYDIIDDVAIKKKVKNRGCRVKKG